MSELDHPHKVGNLNWDKDPLGYKRKGKPFIGCIYLCVSVYTSWTKVSYSFNTMQIHQLTNLHVSKQMRCRMERADCITRVALLP